MLRGSYNVRLASDWQGGDEALMIALHARRTMIVALTGADRLIVLDELGIRSLPHALQAKARAVLQSCSAWRRLDKTSKHLRAVMVGAPARGEVAWDVL